MSWQKDNYELYRLVCVTSMATVGKEYHFPDYDVIPETVDGPRQSFTVNPTELIKDSVEEVGKQNAVKVDTSSISAESIDLDSKQAMRSESIQHVFLDATGL
ncbi:hypothetical protein L914_12316 [Phytophthora nicotianae]|uniref:Uncharacterized protein n=1 Tax=Phytophthora nicotianae TaxID=4792 RepID=W2N0A0_PHYNI|nr:hypothetical protein L914_12316 [Phytophthora nicotianae]